METMTITQVSVVIPVYNELENVTPLIQEVQDAFVDYPIECEIVMIDDGSDDGTWGKLLDCKQAHPNLTIIRHKDNFGQSAAIVTGVRAAKYDWIVTLDGDGQNDPKDAISLIAEANYKQGDANKIVVVGNRRERNDTGVRRFSSRVANKVRASLLRDGCPDTGCSLKLFPKAMFLQIPHFNHLHRFLPALFKRAGAAVYNVPVNHRPRTRGQSKYGVMNRLWVGIVDLFGVVWLLRRPCRPETEVHN